MQLSKSKRTLRLVKSSFHPVVAGAPEPDARGTPATREYYRRIENYAHKIRRADDVGAIIHILDEALGETRALNDGAYSSGNAQATSIAPTVARPRVYRGSRLRLARPAR